VSTRRTRPCQRPATTVLDRRCEHACPAGGARTRLAVTLRTEPTEATMLEGWGSLPARTKLIVLVTAAAVLGLVLWLAFSGGTHAPRAPVAAPASHSPTPTPTPANSVSPLTGLPGAAGRVIAVKIDNIVYARPQTGINYADVVYAIEVEGGLSRFLT